MIADIGADAARGYTQPLVTVLGEGMNSGWYNCAKPLSMFNTLPFGLAVGMINVPLVVIDNTMKTFNFEGNLPIAIILDKTFESQNLSLSVDAINSTFSSMSPTEKAAFYLQTGINPDDLGIDSLVHFKAANQPTIFGSDTGKNVSIDSLFAPGGVESKTLKTILAYNKLQHMNNNPDTIDLSHGITLPFRGLGKIIDKLGGIMFSVPSLSVEAGISKIPVIGNLTVGMRLIPETDLHSLSSDIPFGKVGLFGYKLQYEYLHLIPGAGLLPIKSSVMFSRNSMWLHSDTVNMDQSSWLTQIIASADAHFGIFGAGIYGGIGFGGSNMDLGVKLKKIDSRLENIDISIPGKNSFRFTIGPRITIGFLEIYGDANFGSVTSYNLGVTAFALTGRGF
jgi:hypothetical protein